MVSKMSEDKKYDEICKKLGFIPCELNDDIPPIEDDNRRNPFSVLTADEIWYLYNNGYLRKS